MNILLKLKFKNTVRKLNKKTKDVLTEMNDFKKIMTVGITVTAALIGTYYIQLFLENTFSNVIFRWSLGWSICLFMAYHATESIISYLNKNNPSEEWVQSYSVFRIHTNDSSIDGWLISENDLIKKNVLLDMIGYIPLDSKLGKPEYIFSHSVIRIEFLFVREQPKYFHLKQVVLPESPPPTFDELGEFELKNKCSDSGDYTQVIAPIRSSHFNPLRELVMHTRRSFMRISRDIDIKDDFLVDVRILLDRLVVSPTEVVLMETFYFKVIGTNLMRFYLNEKVVGEFTNEQAKECEILEHTVETLNAMFLDS